MWISDETTNVDTTSAPAPADGGADVVAANADHVNAMLSLATPRESTDDDSSPDYIETPRSASSATAVSTHIDREVKVGDEDLNLLRAYPTLSLHDVTYRDRKTGRTPVEHLTLRVRGRHGLRHLVPDGDDMARTAMVGPPVGIADAGIRSPDEPQRGVPQPRTARTARTPHRPGAAAVRGARRPLSGAEPRVRHGRLQPQLPQAQARAGPRTAAGVRTGRNAVGQPRRFPERGRPSSCRHRTRGVLRGGDCGA